MAVPRSLAPLVSNMAPFCVASLKMKNYLLQRQINRLLAANRGVENELSFLQAELSLNRALARVDALQEQLRAHCQEQARHQQQATDRQHRYRHNRRGRGANCEVREAIQVILTRRAKVGWLSSFLR